MDGPIKLLIVLMVQGSGPSSSVPLPIAVYPSIETCRDAVEYLKKNERTLWTNWTCAPIQAPPGFQPLVPISPIPRQEDRQ